MSDTNTTRRKKGSSGLRKLDDGRYRIEVRNRDGRLSRIFEAPNDTEAEVRAAAIAGEIRAELRNRKSATYTERAERQTWTVARYVDYYLASSRFGRLASTTRARYTSILEHNVVPRIGTMKMSEVTTDDLLEMYRVLGADGARVRGGEGGLSGLTVLTVAMVTRALFTFACEIAKDFPENPAAGKGALPDVDRTPRKPKSLTIPRVEEIVALTAKHTPDIAVPVALCAYLGTRRGETCGLRFSDIDYDGARITVRRSLAHTGADGLTVKLTKTSKSREIPLDPDTIAYLREVQAERRRTRMRHRRTWKGAEKAADDYIASNLDGSPMRPDAFGSRFRVFTEQQKVDGVTLHAFRHAFVSQLIALGYDAVTIAAITGHSPDVLLRTYAHAFDGRKREAMTKLGAERRRARDAMA